MDHPSIAVPLAAVPMAFIDASILVYIPTDTMWLLIAVELADVLRSLEKVLASSYGAMHKFLLTEYVFLIMVQVGVIHNILV